jgi:hypothetical protein
MRAAEFMRALADVIDTLDGDKENKKDPSELEDNPVFVPPLQQKIELMKKSSGIQSVFDQADDDGPLED